MMEPSASAAPSCTWQWTRWGTCWPCTSARRARMIVPRSAVLLKPSRRPRAIASASPTWTSATLEIAPPEPPRHTHRVKGREAARGQEGFRAATTALGRGTLLCLGNALPSLGQGLRALRFNTRRHASRRLRLPHAQQGRSTGHWFLTASRTSANLFARGASAFLLGARSSPPFGLPTAILRVPILATTCGYKDAAEFDRPRLAGVSIPRTGMRISMLVWGQMWEQANIQKIEPVFAAFEADTPSARMTTLPNSLTDVNVRCRSNSSRSPATVTSRTRSRRSAGWIVPVTSVQAKTDPNRPKTCGCPAKSSASASKLLALRLHHQGMV